MEAARSREPLTKQRQIPTPQRDLKQLEHSCASTNIHAGGLGCRISGVWVDFQSCHTRASVTHHFVGVIPVVFHAVLHQLLLVQVPRAAVRTHERGAVGNAAEESKDELRSEGKLH